MHSTLQILMESSLAVPRKFKHRFWHSMWNKSGDTCVRCKRVMVYADFLRPLTHCVTKTWLKELGSGCVGQGAKTVQPGRLLGRDTVNARQKVWTEIYVFLWLSGSRKGWITSNMTSSRLGSTSVHIRIASALRWEIGRTEHKSNTGAGSIK